jgi:RNA polymerase sigma factor (sigma-70 family)
MQRGDPDLRALMVSAQQGDKPSYRALLDQCGRWLRRYYARRLPPALIDDIVQETLISVHRKRASYDTSRPFLPWLAAIARYRWVDALRKMRETVEIDETHAVTEDVSGAVIARLSLERLMDNLPAAQAVAITLTKVEGCSIAETARLCGQSEAAIKVNIHRGIKKLRVMIEND